MRDVLPPVGGLLAASTPYAVGRAALRPDAGRFETAGFHEPSIVGLARSAGWLSMYVGLPWAHARAALLAAAAADRLAATPGVTLVTPRGAMATLVSFRVEGWTGDQVAEELGRRVHAIVRSIPGLDCVRLSVAFFTTEDELRRVLDGVAEIAAHTPVTLAPATRDRVPGASGDVTEPGRPIRERGWLEVRWRQLRRAPTPVVRAVVSSVGVAAVLGILFLAYDLVLDGGAALPGGDLRVLAGFVFVAAVAILGSWLTYLAVPQPGRPGARSRWSAALGLFAALPIAYLALVILFQVVKPLLVGSGG